MQNQKFDIKQTNIVKGVAVLLLLWHHLFFNNPEFFDRYTSLFWFKGIPIEAFISLFCKVCVAIFMFISGYGLFISYSKYSKDYENAFNISVFKSDLVFVKNRLIKLLSSYWVVFIVFVPIGLFFGKSFIEVYGNNPLHYVTDFFGLSYLFYGYDFTMNKTWWYMSVIIVYYLIYPLLHRLCKRSPEVLFAVAFFITMTVPNFRELQMWLLPFCFGVYVSSRKVFDWLNNVLLTCLTRIVFTVGIIAGMVYARYALLDNSAKFDFAFAFGIILFTYFIISKISIVNKVLEEFGKKSGLIFMFHTFIYSIYFKSFVYSFKYSVLIFVIFTIICYIVAWLLEQLMKITGYQKLIKKLTT